MAEPARKINDPYDQPGNDESSERSRLKSLEGGGESSPRREGHLQAVSDDHKPGTEFKTNLSGANSSEDSLYKNRSNKPSLAANLRKKKRWLAAGTAIAAALIALLVALFGFLNLFKLDGLMSNIDAKVFLRYNSIIDRRSDKWIAEYFTIRLTQIKGDANTGDSQYFRAHRVDTNNPVRDWFKTLSASNFETDLRQKGIAFVNKTSGPNAGFVVLEFDGKEVAGLKGREMVDRLNRGDVTVLRSVEIELDKPGGSKKARQVIKDLTRNENVIKRRQVRKAIQNMTGVRSWRFFETTRDKATAKRIDIRNKIITTMIPDSTLGGKFVRCLFGMTDCKFNADPSAPENQAGSALIGEGNPNKTNDPVNIQDEKPDGTPKYDDKGNPVTHAQSVDLQSAADLFKGIVRNVGKAINTLNVLATLDAFAKLSDAIHNHELSKGVTVARGIQAMGLYQVFETSRDQIKTGQVSASEVNDFMQVIGTAAGSEGWTKVIGGQGNPGQITQTSSTVPGHLGSKEYCNYRYQERLQWRQAEANKQFAYLCPDKRIGADSNAGTLEDAYNNTIGGVIEPFVKVWKTFRSGFFGILIDFFNKLTELVFKPLIAVLDNILKVAGVRDSINQALQWMVRRSLAFLGAGPIMTGQESAGQYMNWMVQGGAYTAEASARANGASTTNAGSKVSTTEAIAAYRTDQASQQSLFQKYLALSNPQSAASQRLISLDQNGLQSLPQKLTDFSSIFRTIGSAFSSLFSHRTSAATVNGYAGAQFAGISSYDYPKQCLDMDPAMMTPQNGTNIQQVIPDVPSTDLTWDLVTNNTAWYNYLYSKTDDDGLATQVYNCNLLDNAVRGGLGNVYGYTKDNGLEDSGGNSSTTPTGGQSDIAAYKNPLRDVQKNGSLVAQRIDQGVDYGGYGPVYAMGKGKVLNLTNSGWPGGTFIVYQLLEGPAAGKFVFFAENCPVSPSLRISQIVDSSTRICTMVDASPHIEIGWADGAALGAAKAHSVWGSSVDDENHYTAYGLNFSQLLEKLGAPAGTIKTGAQKLGSLEAGWPTW